MAMPLYLDTGLPATEQRAAKAVCLAAAFQEMVQRAPPAGAKQAAWAVNRAVVAHSLSFDARVLPCSLVLSHAALVTQAVLRVAADVLGEQVDQLGSATREQLVLPTRKGGMQLDLPDHVLPFARAASLMEVGPLLRATIHKWEDGSIDPTEFDGVRHAVHDGLFDGLQARGIHALAGDGRPQKDARDAKPEEQLRPPVPARHLQSAMQRHAADKAYDKLLASSGSHDSIRLRSAAGPTAGASLTAPLSVFGVSFTDAEFELALRWRLGLATGRGPALCQNWSATSDMACGVVLDDEGDHAVSCPSGPLAVARHEGLADCWGDIYEEVGALVRREVYVHSLSTRKQEAWLDVAAYGVQELAGMLFDVTVRHPRETRYLPASAERDGAATEKAAEEKRDRCPPKNGAHVVTLCHETWGRLGEEAERMLALCGSLATRRDHRRCRLPGNRMQRWRAQLDAALHRAVAAQIHSARNGLGGHAHRRKRPTDISALEANAAWPVDSRPMEV